MYARCHGKHASGCFGFARDHLYQPGSVFVKEDMRPTQREDFARSEALVKDDCAQSFQGWGHFAGWLTDSSSVSTRSRCTSPWASVTLTGFSILSPHMRDYKRAEVFATRD